MLMHVYSHALTPNSINTTVHRIHKVEITDHSVNLVLNSFTTAEATVPAWQDTYPMPLADFVLTPFPQCVFDYLIGQSGPFVAGAVVHDPAEIITSRQAKRVDVNRLRDATINGGCETSFGFMDTNERSRQNINLTLSAMAEDGEATWRRLDNSDVVLNKTEFAQMAAEVDAHVQRAMQYSWTVKALIEAAETLEELETIDINGWSNTLPIEPEPEPEPEA